MATPKDRPRGRDGQEDCDGIRQPVSGRRRDGKGAGTGRPRRPGSFAGFEGQDREPRGKQVPVGPGTAVEPREAPGMIWPS